MAQVAANQDRSEKLRSQYVYQQRIHVVSRKGNGKVLREETADYHVVPSPTAPGKHFQQLTGRYWHGGRYVDFSGEPVPDPTARTQNWFTAFARILLTTIPRTASPVISSR